MADYSHHTFVQDEGWYQAGERYSDFIRRHKERKTLFLELGVGMNTPEILKYPFSYAVNFAGFQKKQPEQRGEKIGRRLGEGDARIAQSV